MTQLNLPKVEASLLRIAPCLADGSLGHSASNLVAACDCLGEGGAAPIVRAWCVAHLFDRMERVFSSAADPIPQINAVLDSCAALLEQARSIGWFGLDGDLCKRHPSHDHERAGTIEEVTGEHYGRLFSAFSVESFLEEPARLLRARLERNGIGVSTFRGKRVLDAGCGGGRYTVAWRHLGAGQVTGIDVSSEGIGDAISRVAEAGINGVEFDTGSVLALPYADSSFDVVFSNGVLHHTRDWLAGVRELVRVLSPGGFGWLYLIEQPGGLFWDLIEVLRAIMRNEDRDLARQALRFIGVSANRVFYMLDHVMVPINLRLSPDEIASALAEAGATTIRRLERGADFDRVEQIYQGVPFAGAKFGVGENRFVFSK